MMRVCAGSCGGTRRCVCACVQAEAHRVMHVSRAMRVCRHQNILVRRHVCKYQDMPVMCHSHSKDPRRHTYPNDLCTLQHPPHSCTLRHPPHSSTLHIPPPCGILHLPPPYCTLNIPPPCDTLWHPVAASAHSSTLRCLVLWTAHGCASSRGSSLAGLYTPVGTVPQGSCTEVLMHPRQLRPPCFRFPSF